jgi:hypothetical protein
VRFHSQQVPHEALGIEPIGNVWSNNEQSHSKALNITIFLCVFIKPSHSDSQAPLLTMPSQSHLCFQHSTNVYKKFCWHFPVTKIVCQQAYYCTVLWYQKNKQDIKPNLCMLWEFCYWDFSINSPQSSTWPPLRIWSNFAACDLC